MTQAQPRMVTTDGDGDSRFVPLTIAPNCNNIGTTTSANLTDGAFNVWGNSLSVDSFPGVSTRLGGIPLELAEWGHGNPDNIRCEGQYIETPRSLVDWLYLLAAGERRAEDDMALHFGDGTVDFEPLRVSDFWVGEAAFGERAKLESHVMHYPHHVQQRVTGRLWLERVPVVRQTELVGFRLPKHAAIHVFAITLRLAESYE